MILTTLQKLPKNVGYLGKLIVAKGFKSCPKSNKSPNLITLLTGATGYEYEIRDYNMSFRPSVLLTSLVKFTKTTDY